MIALHVDQPRREEPHPPLIESLQAFPYPDLTRLWLRMTLSPFNRYPNVEVYVYGPEENLVAETLIVEHRTPVVDATLHLRQPPQPGAWYRLEAFLVRDNEILDQKEHTFRLIFVDPKTGRPVDPKTGEPLSDQNGR